MEEGKECPYSAGWRIIIMRRRNSFEASIEIINLLLGILEFGFG